MTAGPTVEGEVEAGGFHAADADRRGQRSPQPIDSRGVLRQSLAERKLVRGGKRGGRLPIGLSYQPAACLRVRGAASRGVMIRGSAPQTSGLTAGGHVPASAGRWTSDRWLSCLSAIPRDPVGRCPRKKSYQSDDRPALTAGRNRLLRQKECAPPRRYGLLNLA
jgi:hypothetical protein